MTFEEARNRMWNLFESRGCVRWRDEVRQEDQTTRVYKKGYEVRLPADSPKDAKELAAAIGALGLSSGKPYEKHHQTIFPIYGKGQVEYIMNLGSASNPLFHRPKAAPAKRKLKRAAPDRSKGNGKSRQGFASMDLERVRKIAALGGRAAHAAGKAHRWNSEEARSAGKKGGKATKEAKRRARS